MLKTDLYTAVKSEDVLRVII